ncbi:MAG TPA: hypothetical protein DCP92_23250 [Nitrospiraceae bacterium]|nr:hypothetical protein [Nitrospiraceae bacterium]
MIKKKLEIHQMKYMYVLRFIPLLLLTMFVLRVAPACAQGNQDLLTAISKQMGQSMQALTGYSYQQRTEVQVNGETKSVQLAQVAFRPNKQPLSRRSAHSPPKIQNAA